MDDVSLTPRASGRMVRGLLLVTDRHETQMIQLNIHNFGAHAARQGTAMLRRHESFGSALWHARCSGVPMVGVITNPPGGRSP